MRAAVITSVSGNISELASVTVPNKLEYCLRHGYSLIADNQPYKHAVRRVRDVILPLLDEYELVWALDCDAVVTDMTTPFHTLPCLGPGATVCEEGIVAWNRLNCGSVIWRSGWRSTWLLERLEESAPEWLPMPCVWQTWLGEHAGRLGDSLTVAPLRAFNSCAWSHPAGVAGDSGSHWEFGDFVFHPCGVFPAEARLEIVHDVIASGVKR